MSTRLLNRKSAIVSLTLATVLVGGIAYGYPPRHKMTVMASAEAATDPDTGVAGTSVTVTVDNANPACKIRVRIEGKDHEYVLPVAGMTATDTFFIAPPFPTGTRLDVRARTVDCTGGDKNEHAKAKFTVSDADVSGDTTAKVGKNYRVDITGLPAGTPVDLVATAPDGTTSGPVSADAGTETDRRGTADLRVNLDQTGTWSIVVTAEPDGEPPMTVGTVTPVVS